jgi:deoxycytidylate deaminase
MIDIQKLHTILLDKFPNIEDRPKHASFLLKAGKIIASGFNSRTKTHPWAVKYGHKFCRVHSELDVLLHFPFALDYLKEFTLVNLRILKSGRLSMSKPCLACQYMLASLKPKRVYYTNMYGILEEF